MSIATIRATFSCDGCGKLFWTDIEPSAKVWKLNQEMMEIAEDSLLGDMACSIQDEMHLCDNCTKVADNIGDEDHAPTRDEINAALDMTLSGERSQ